MSRSSGAIRRGLFLDRDGVITVADIMRVAAVWGTVCE